MWDFQAFHVWLPKGWQIPGKFPWHFCFWFLLVHTVYWINPRFFGVDISQWTEGLWVFGTWRGRRLGAPSWLRRLSTNFDFDEKTGFSKGINPITLILNIPYSNWSQLCGNSLLNHGFWGGVYNIRGKGLKGFQRIFDKIFIVFLKSWGLASHGYFNGGFEET